MRRLLLLLLLSLLALSPARAADKLVFIPGILGSKLCPDSGCKSVHWPSITNEVLIYKGKNAEHISSLNKAAGEQLYGSVILGLDAKFTAPDKFSQFTYDWRESNTVTAESFKTHVSKNVGKDDKLIIVAHSMGGLVVRHWLQGLSDDELKKIKAIIFVATPHFGAPKPLYALIDKYSLASEEQTGSAKNQVNENSVLGKLVLGVAEWINKLKKRGAWIVLSGALDEEGVSFHSGYNLLPQKLPRQEWGSSFYYRSGPNSSDEFKTVASDWLDNFGLMGKYRRVFSDNDDNRYNSWRNKREANFNETKTLIENSEKENSREKELKDRIFALYALKRGPGADNKTQVAIDRSSIAAIKILYRQSNDGACVRRQVEGNTHYFCAQKMLGYGDGTVPVDMSKAYCDHIGLPARNCIQVTGDHFSAQEAPELASLIDQLKGHEGEQFLFVRNIQDMVRAAISKNIASQDACNQFGGAFQEICVNFVDESVIKGVDNDSGEQTVFDPTKLAGINTNLDVGDTLKAHLTLLKSANSCNGSSGATALYGKARDKCGKMDDDKMDDDKKVMLYDLAGLATGENAFGQTNLCLTIGNPISNYVTLGQYQAALERGLKLMTVECRTQDYFKGRKGSRTYERYLRGAGTAALALGECKKYKKLVKHAKEKNFLDSNSTHFSQHDSAYTNACGQFPT